MNADQKRDVVLNMYKSPSWKKRVRKMPDAQVLAIYRVNFEKEQK